MADDDHTLDMAQADSQPGEDSSSPPPPTATLELTQCPDAVRSKLAGTSVTVTSDGLVVGRKVDGLPDAFALTGAQGVSKHHFEVTLGEDRQFMITDKSTNGIYLNAVKIADKSTARLDNGTTVGLMNPSAGADKRIVFVFKYPDQPPVQPPVNDDETSEEEEEEEEEMQFFDEPAPAPAPAPAAAAAAAAPAGGSLSKKRKRRESQAAAGGEDEDEDEGIGAELECGVCREIMYRPLAVLNCMHKFCSACLHDWLTTQDTNGRRKCCPMCKGPVVDVVRDTSFANVVEEYLAKHPNKQRSQADRDEMDKKDKAVRKFMGGGKQRRAYDDDDDLRDDYSEGSGDDDVPNECFNCNAASARDGYRCPSDPAQRQHTMCNECFQLMPRRDPPPPNCPMKCFICDKYFCSPYRPLCPGSMFQGGDRAFIGGDSLQRAKDMDAINTIPDKTFKFNSFEKGILREVFANTQTTVKQALTSVFQNLANAAAAGGGAAGAGGAASGDGGAASASGTQTQTQGPPAPPGTLSVKSRTGLVKHISGDEYVCRRCGVDVIAEALYEYRASLPRPSLPQRAQAQTQNCWWGRNCRTQNRDHHAQKLNHICEQTRFT